MLTLIQGYLYITVFLTSVALRLPTSFSLITEMMKWSLLELFHDTIIKIVQCRYSMLVKENCEHQTNFLFRPKPPSVAVRRVNDKRREHRIKHTESSLQLTGQRTLQQLFSADSLVIMKLSYSLPCKMQSRTSNLEEGKNNVCLIYHVSN